MKKIFVIQPINPEFLPPYALIREIAESLGVSIARADDIPSVRRTVIEKIYEAIEKADLIICDISLSNPNVMYELGYAHALQKPVIHIANRMEPILFDIRSVRAIFYDFEIPNNIIEFRQRLQDAIKDALKNPGAYSNRPKTETEINSVFISYSHKDTEFLNRLLVHLQPLQNEGLIDFWADTKIKAGDKWRNEIEEALKRARAAILLVSADFLASEFIVKNELPPLLDKAEMEGTRIIPVIIKPCRFARDKHLSRFQAINSPSSPLIMLEEGERESYYDQVAEAVEKLTVK
jgi:hypothetical protein